MKLVLLIPIILFLPIESKSSDIQPQDNLIASALEEYAKVAGSWFLNEKCNYIKGEKKIRFKDNLSLITVTLANDLGSPKLLYPIQVSAKSAAANKKYADCKGTARDIFNYGYSHSMNWSDQIRILQHK